MTEDKLEPRLLRTDTIGWASLEKQPELTSLPSSRGSQPCRQRARPCLAPVRCEWTRGEQEQRASGRDGSRFQLNWDWSHKKMNLVGNSGRLIAHLCKRLHQTTEFQYRRSSSITYYIFPGRFWYFTHFSYHKAFFCEFLVCDSVTTCIHAWQHWEHNVLKKKQKIALKTSFLEPVERGQRRQRGRGPSRCFPSQLALRALLRHVEIQGAARFVLRKARLFSHTRCELSSHPSILAARGTQTDARSRLPLQTFNQRDIGLQRCPLYTWTCADHCFTTSWPVMQHEHQTR